MYSNCAGIGIRRAAVFQECPGSIGKMFPDVQVLEKCAQCQTFEGAVRGFKTGLSTPHHHLHP